MRTIHTNLVRLGMRRPLPGLFGLMTAATAMLAGCDATGTDISAQISSFAQDFARQALAAWAL